jgi:FkbM family methyltransferase
LRTALRDNLARLIRRVCVRGGWRVAPALHRAFGSDSGPVVVRIPGAGWCELDLRDQVQRQVFWTGLDANDRRIIRFLRAAVRPDGIFLDVGANIGLHTLAVARQLRSGRAIAFEPHPVNFQILARNIGRNGIRVATPIEAALSDAVGTVRAQANPATGNWSMKAQGAQAVEIKTLTLDHFVAEHRLARIDAIKLDVEGHEPQVLLGGRDALRRHRPPIVFEANVYWLKQHGRSVPELFQILESLDYRVFHLAASPGALNRVAAPDSLPLDDPGYFVNLVAVAR